MTHPFARTNRKERSAPAPVLEGLTLMEELPACRAARRWKGRDAHGEPWTAYLVRAGREESTPLEVRERLMPLVSLSHPHLLPVDRVTSGEGGRVWVVSPYTGNHDGLVTLASLLPMKDGGQMSQAEAERAVLHTLEAMGELHKRGLYHGPLRADELLVDRHGSVMIELPCVLRLAQGLNRGDAELVRDEIHSLGVIAYQLLTGLEPGTPCIPASRLVKRLSRAWDAWLETALDESAGFFSVADAIAALPMSADSTGASESSEQPAVRTRAAGLLRRIPGVGKSW